jgi:hypothetical protein
MRCAGRRVLRDIARARRVAREAFAIPRPPRKRPLRGQSLIEREKVASLVMARPNQDGAYAGRQFCAAPIVSALTAPRRPRGLSGPTVESFEV